MASERMEFVESYRVPAADMSLRPVRAECSKWLLGEGRFLSPSLIKGEEKLSQ